MAAGSIVIDLLMKTGSFETDTKRATKAAEKNFKDLQKSAAAVGAAISASFVGAAGGLAYFFKSTLDGIDALNDVADATGASIENISALEDVALRTGASLDSVSSIMVKFNGILKEADGKNSASQALASIGLEAEQLKKLDPAEALRQTAVALSQFADDGNKARVVQELFGKSVKDAAPFLKDLADQTELTATVTAKQAQAAEDFNKVMFELSKNTTDLARDLAGPLVDALNEVTKRFKEGRAAGKGFLEIGLDNYWKEVRDFWGMGQPSSGGASGGWDVPSADRPSISVPQLPGANSEAESKAIAKAEADRVKQRATAAKAQESAFQSYLNGLQRQIEKTQELSATEQTMLDISLGRAEATTRGQKDILLGLAQQIDASKQLELDEKSREESARRLAAAQKQVAQEAAAIYEATRTPLERYQAGMERLQELYDAGHIKDVETYTRATKLLGDEFVQSGEKTKEAIDQFTEFAKQAERNIQDALGSTLEQTMAGNFESIGQMWLQLIQKMAAQALAARLNEALFGSGSSGGGLLSGLAKAFIGSASGSSIGNAGAGDYKGFYDGGGGAVALATGTNYVPRDEFPAILHKGEAVVPAKYNPAAGGMGGAAKVDMSGQTIYIGQGVSRGEVTAAIEAGNARVKAELMRSLQQRGV